jgi:ribose 1,5-bisphosphokinase
MTQASDRAGRLVYVMGPSGAGKDTLIGYARARSDPARVVFAHRYITRAADVSGENHVVLNEREFFSRNAAGLFALAWESHGFRYAIGAEIDLWRAQGLNVVASGARAAWPLAATRYPSLVGVLVDAPLASRAARLATRGRENESAIRERLERDVALPADNRIHRVDNSGLLAHGGEALIKLLE